MLRNLPDRVQVIESGGDPVFDPETGQTVYPDPVVVAEPRCWFGYLSAEERRIAGADFEGAEGFLLLPPGGPVTTTATIRDPHGDGWNVAGVEHHRGHDRVLLKRSTA